MFNVGFLFYLILPYILVKSSSISSNFIYGIHEAISEVIIIFFVLMNKSLEKKCKLILSTGFLGALCGDLCYTLSILNPARESTFLFSLGEIFYVYFYSSVGYYLWHIHRDTKTELWARVIGLVACSAFCFLTFNYVLIPFYLRTPTPAFYFIFFCTLFSLIEIYFVYKAFHGSIQAKNKEVFLFNIAILMMCFGDFAIRYEEAFTINETLSGIEYAWATAMSIHVFNFYNMYRDTKNIAVDYSPLKSLRVVSVISSLTFIGIFLIFLSRMGLISFEGAIHISGALVSFGVSWFVANLYSLALSKHAEKFSLSRSVAALSEFQGVFSQYQQACDKVATISDEHFKLQSDHKSLHKKVGKERKFAHEMKGPFNVMTMLFSQIYADPSEKNIKELVSKHLPVLKDQLLKIDRMVELFGIKKDLGKNITTLNLKGVVSRSTKEFSLSHPTATVQISIPEEIMIVSDWVTISISISNILLNIAEEIDLKSTSIFIDYHPESGSLAIKNTNTYVKDSNLEKIFEEGFSDKRVISSGIGLSSVKVLLENIGCKIRCDRKSGFFITRFPPSKKNYT